MEGHGEAIIKFLGANDAILASIHHEAAKAGVSWVRSIELGEEVLVIDGDNAGNISFAFKGLHPAEHGILVLLDGLVDYTRQDVHITLSASKSHLSLNKLNKTLNEQVLEKISVLLLIVLEAFGHLDASSGLQAFDELVSALHAIDTRFVLRLRFLNLKVALSNLQVLEHLIVESLLLSLDHLLRLHSEVGLHLLGDLVDTLATLLLNELDHASHDSLLL